MKEINHFLLFILALSIPTVANAAGSALRVMCDGDAEGAEVYINGKFRGECPLDMKVPAGMLKLRVQKTVDGEHEPLLFEQEIRMGEDVLKKVEVEFGPLELNAAGKRRQEELALLQQRRQGELALQAFNSIEAGMVAIPGKNYAMGKYEVTQGQWKVVMGNNPSYSKTCGNDCPVDQVSWNDAQDFISKLNAKTGKQYRLPTEAEWEYACYGGSQTAYCGGNDLDAVGWYDNNSGGVSHPVGQKQANGYGLYDMSGNVWELMQNCVDYAGPCAKRAMRGGSWFEGANSARAARDDSIYPTNRSYFNGFRVARTLP